MAPIAHSDILSDDATLKDMATKAPVVSFGGKNTKLTPLQGLSHGSLSLAPTPQFDNHLESRKWMLEHMAAAFRHWSREGYIEGMSGHISVRDPEFPHAFWTNPLGVHFGLLRPSDMIMVNYEGNVIGGNRKLPANSAGFLIHSAIHKARPDVNAVCHAHSLYGKAWSVFGKPLEMLTQDTCKFFGDAQAVYNNHGGVVLDENEGLRIAEAIGPAKGGILRNHGIITVGHTVDEAAFLFTSMERSCRVQLLAEAAAANGIQKVVIANEEARLNYNAESDPDVCYREFQVYFDYEKRLSGGTFES